MGTALEHARDAQLLLCPGGHEGQDESFVQAHARTIAKHEAEARSEERAHVRGYILDLLGGKWKSGDMILAEKVLKFTAARGMAEP